MTIREIAKLCGVSRGTVDRVINGRGKVHPETKALVEKTLAEAGYTKNTAAQALAVRKAAPVIGVVLSSEGNPFFDDVIRGIRAAETELVDYGVQVVLLPMRGYRTQAQLAHIEALEDRMSVLVVQAINAPVIAEKINALAEKGIPTITVNSDLESSRRACYVGSDYAKGGQTAAGIMRAMTGGVGKLGIIAGVETVLGHRLRLRAFEEHLRMTCPGMDILCKESADDDVAHAYARTKAMLTAHPAIDTMMLIAAGLEGVCAAVQELGMEKRIRLFGFDNIPMTEAMMRRDLLKAVICQQPFQQGHRAVRAAFDAILHGKPEQDKYIMENQIKILENLRD